MKTGIFIDEQRKTREVLTSLGTELVDQFGKIYYRLDAILEQVGTDTFIVHFDNDIDVPEYLIAVRGEFIQDKKGKGGRIITAEEKEKLLNP